MLHTYNFRQDDIDPCMQALYRGNGADVLRLVPEVALKFGLNDQLKIMFTPADGKPMSFSRKLAAGATAGVLKVSLCSSSHLCCHVTCRAVALYWFT